MKRQAKRGRPPSPDPLDSLAQIRCKANEKRAWFDAAGSKRAFSEWARRVLNEAGKTTVASASPVDTSVRTRRGGFYFANGIERNTLWSMNAVANPIRTEYCTTEEAAQLLDVHPSQLTRYVQDGRLQPERIGRQMLFLRREVQKFKAPGRGFRSDLARSGKS